MRYSASSIAMVKPGTFFYRWGLISADLWMTVGTGNMLRVHRMVTQVGDTASLITGLIILSL